MEIGKEDPYYLSEEEKKSRIEEVSQKIFGKSSRDIRYTMVTNYIHQQLLDEGLTRTGCYQWINVFRGEVKYPRDVLDFNDYDIVQVNMSAQDIHLVQNIREQLGSDSKTKIVLNNDYTTEVWGLSFDYPNIISREINGADMLFGTEYFQSTALAELSGRNVSVIPHPADVKRIKSLTPVPKKELLTTIWRRYDAFIYIPHLVTRNHGITTQLIGYDKKLDKKVWLTTTLYDYVYAGTNYLDFCNQLQESKVMYDPFTFHSYSRTTVDTAALKTAVVGSSRTQSVPLLYPYTTLDPYDVRGGRILINKLLTDKSFYDKVIDTAYERVEFYNHLNSKYRYMVALEKSLEEKDSNVNQVIYKKELVKGRGDDILQVKARELNRNGNKKTN